MDGLDGREIRGDEGVVNNIIITAASHYHYPGDAREFPCTTTANVPMLRRSH